MRLVRLRVEAFGRFRDFDTGADDLPGLLAVYGPNEAGKTTLLRFIETLLYGFHPANAAGHPYAPWDGTAAGGAGWFRLADGCGVEVERRLRSTPAAVLRRGDTTEVLRNRPLPWVAHLPRSVYAEVYTFTTPNLDHLDEGAWGEVQDRLIGGMGSESLRSARVVADELEQEAGRLLRPDRRGNQRIREVRSRIAELRTARRDCLEGDRRLRDDTRTLAELRESLDALRLERERERERLERLEDLAPIRQQLGRIDELRREAGDEEELRGLPADPAAALDEGERSAATLREEAERLQSEAADLERRIRLAEEADDPLLARAVEVRRVCAEALDAARDAGALNSLRGARADLDRRIAAAAAGILEGEPGPDAEAALRRLSFETLQQAAAAAERQRAAAALAAQHAGEAAPGGAERWFPLILAVAGVALLGYGRNSGAGLVVGAMLFSAGVVWAVFAYRALRPRTNDAAGDAQDPLRTLREHLASLSLAVPPEEVTPDVVASLRRLRDLLQERDEVSRRIEPLERRIAGLEERVKAAAREAGVDTDGTFDGIARHLAERLSRAEQRREQVARDRADLERSTREAERLRAKADAAERETETLRRRLARIGNGDPREGARAAATRRRAAERAERLAEDLEDRHGPLPELRARVARAAGDPDAADEGDVAGTRARLERLTTEVEELATRIGELEVDLEHRAAQDTVDAVDGEIAALEAEEHALLEEHDRLRLLARLVRRADRTFRDRHQPDVLREAGRHLQTLTGGRYRRILAPEHGGAFLVEDAEGETRPLAPPLSRGTLEQAYLALRLGIIEHLDRDHEPLPAILDEATVHWDPQRRARALDALAGLAERRQVILLTCHPHLAHEVRQRGGGVLDLADAEGAAP